MLTPMIRFTAAVCLAWSALSADLPATEKLDLARVTPVPAGEPIPAADFFRLRLMNEPKLNRTGTHIAAVIAGGADDTQLMVYDLKSQQMERLSGELDTDIYFVDWLNENRVIFGISLKKMAGIGLFAGNVGAIHGAYPLIQYVGSRLVAIPPDDRTHPLVRLAPDSVNTGQYGEIVTIDTEISTGKIISLKLGSVVAEVDESRSNNDKHILKRFPPLKTKAGFDLTYFTDKEGHPAFGITSEDGTFALHRLNEGQWQKCPENLDEIEVLGSGDNPGEIVVLGQRQEGKTRALETMNAATGAAIETLVQDKSYDPDALLYRDPVSHNIVGVRYDRGTPTVIWFTESYRALQKAADGLFPGKVVRILGTDDAGKVVLISASSDRQPAIYSWVDLEKHTAGLIKNSAPWIDPERMQPVNLLKFKTKDGRQLDAYVTLPSGTSKKRPAPLVVLPHDDHFARNYMEFHAEAQFFASRGYAVLQPNYRGSLSYSGLFPKEDEWDFHKMHEDVTEATKTLIATGLVDRNRVAIFGSRFGGFLAMSGVAFEPGLYRCAAAVSPVLDWATVLSDQKYFEHESATYTRLRKKLGDPKTEHEKFSAIAPGRHVDTIQTPVFIINGEYDLSVNLSEAKDLVSALKRRNIAAEILTFANEGEGIEHLDHKVEMYQRLEAFLAKNLAPVAATAASP
jgi:dienelactone hydrolase